MMSLRFLFVTATSDPGIVPSQKELKLDLSIEKQVIDPSKTYYVKYMTEQEIEESNPGFEHITRAEKFYSVNKYKIVNGPVDEDG